MNICMENGCSLAVAGKALMMSYFVLTFFPRDALN